MAKKCRTCSKSAQIYGLEDAPYMEIATVTASAYGTAYIDKMLTTNSDGTPKTEGMFVEQPLLRKALFVAGGVGLTAFMKGDLYKNVGVGMATYGLYGVVESLMQPSTSSVTGLTFQPPTNIAGLRTLTGNYGVAPSIVAGHGMYGQHDMGYTGSDHRGEEVSEMFAERQEVSGLVRAL